MAAWIGVVVFAVSLILVIVIHEAAHFGMAKLFKIKVEEFFVGFGPRLLSVKRGETEYGIKAIPAGGYVRIAGMNPYEEPTPEEYPRTFGAKPIWQRALVIFAGPATHFVIAFLILVGYLLFLGAPSRFAAQIDKVSPKSPAAAAGLQPGDEIMRLDGIARPSPHRLQKYTANHAGQPITLVVRRDGRRRTIEVTPELVKTASGKVARIGVEIGAVVLARDREGLGGAVTDAGRQVGRLTTATIDSLGRVFGPQGLSRVGHLLFSNAPRKATDPTTFVGVGQAVGQAASHGLWDDVLLIIASINVFVGILNLLPLPPFDGGHLAVLAVEKVRGRKVDMRKLIPLTAVVAAFLVLFMVSVLYLDIVKPIPNLFR